MCGGAWLCEMRCQPTVAASGNKSEVVGPANGHCSAVLGGHVVFNALLTLFHPV